MLLDYNPRLLLSNSGLVPTHFNEPYFHIEDIYP